LAPPVEEGHLPSPEENRYLDPVPCLEKIFNSLGLELVIVLIDFRPHLHFLYGLALGLLASVFFAFLLLVFVLPVIKNSTYGRVGLRRHLHQVQFPLLREGKGLADRNYANFNPLVVDEQNFLCSDFLIDSRFVTLFSYCPTPPVFF
ncbi:MAG: hypothetical protein PWR18_721, partial [Synergistales bacterium]|nr:hypothetical protein [Synergistales bacterium]